MRLCDRIAHWRAIGKTCKFTKIPQIMLTYEVVSMAKAIKANPNWLRCPRCSGKTRIQLRPHTVLEDFPLFCPKCKYTCVIQFKNGKTIDLKMPDA